MFDGVAKETDGEGSWKERGRRKQWMESKKGRDGKANCGKRVDEIEETEKRRREKEYGERKIEEEGIRKQRQYG